MNILIVTQYFYPETFKSTDLALELQKRGHNVTVLTGLPNYPEGEIYEGYGYFKRRRENIDGVDVHRALLIPRGKGGGIRLFLNYYSWAFFASLKVRKIAKKIAFDAVIVHEPSPIIQFYPALTISRIQKIPVYFWVMDLWPESLRIAGGVQNRFILNYYSKLVTKFYNHSEKILITSKGFAKSICEKGDFADKIKYFPNWAEDLISDGDTSYPIPSLPDGFRILFAGNIGESQDMESIMEAALALKNYSIIKFIFIGEGRRSQFLKDFIEKNSLQNTVFCLGRFPVTAMATFFSKADLLLVSLKDDPIFNLTVPAKVQAYMSSGKPILGMLNGEGADIINDADCGFTVPASDSKKLAEIIIEASQMDKTMLSRKGDNGKKYYNKYFKMSECISNLERILKRE